MTIRKIALAHPHRECAARLASYLRETESEWDVSAFTQTAALRVGLRENGRTDLLLGHPEMLRQLPQLSVPPGRIAALVERAGEAEGEWPEIMLFQPLSGILAGIRGLMTDASAGEECRLWTVFSASGGAGKTTAALNLARQAGERGMRVLYLNLEPLNATSGLTGCPEPDSLSRLLYALQTGADRFDAEWARRVRHHPRLLADFIDAPEWPAERTAMTPELLEALIGRLRGMGRYDLVIADPDSGVSDWHARLISLSGRVLWLVPDDWQGIGKAERLAAYWQEHWNRWADRIAFVRSKGLGAAAPGWKLPSPPEAVLPYIPQWKSMSDPGQLLGAAAFSAVLEELLDRWV